MKPASSSRWFALLTLALCLAACSQAKRAPVPLDCSVLDHYELSPNGSYNSGNWFSSGDGTTYVNDAGSVQTVSYGSLGESVCGINDGILFTSSGNHNWGSLAGNYVVDPNGFAATPPADKDASAFIGLSFWARSNYSRVFAIILGDDTSTPVNGDAGHCIPSTLSLDGGVASANGQVTDAMVIPNPDYYGFGSVPLAEGCDDPFVAQIVTTDRWQFYTIPFSAFVQVTQDPRVKPGGINKSSIYGIVIRAPKDSTVESWFANFAWYREKP